MPTLSAAVHIRHKIPITSAERIFINRIVLVGFHKLLYGCLYPNQKWLVYICVQEMHWFVRAKAHWLITGGYSAFQL